MSNIVACILFLPVAFHAMLPAGRAPLAHPLSAGGIRLPFEPAARPVGCNTGRSRNTDSRRNGHHGRMRSAATAGTSEAWSASEVMVAEQSVMKHRVLAFLLLAATACTSDVDLAREASQGTPGGRRAPTDAASRTGLVYAAVVHQLVERDHGYGTAPSPYRRVYVIDGAVPHASELRGGIGFRRVARPV